MPASAVLVVEDERIVAKDLQQILVEMGYDAFAIASSFDEAVRRAAERRPDVVLMDIRIKGPVDGVETARVLRERFDVPVIFLTAHADDSTIERAKQLGPHGYLMKPVKPGELKSAIEVSLFKHDMECRLREREAWFAATLRSIADPVLAMDRSGRTSFANPAAQALGEAALAQPMARALAGETVENVELFVPHVGRWFTVNANPVREPDGTVRGAVTVGRDITDLRLALDQLRQAAIRDELTGLLNRRGFQDHAQRLVELANRGARPLAIIYVDLNGMKAINDRHGHAAGDRALVETAELLRRTFRTTDLVARLGGDEFVVVAPEYAEDANGGAVRRRFAEHLAALHAVGARAFRLSATMGIIIYDPRARRRTVEELLAEADAKMYAAKARRRLEGSLTVEPVG